MKIDYRPYNSGGKGGQHSNKTLNAIEATTTLPDGRVIKANSSCFKSQYQNKKAATEVLISRVRDALKPVHERPDTSERVRTYNAHRGEVIDHASGLRRKYKDVLDGDDALGDLIEARMRAKKEQDEEKRNNNSI